MLPLNHSISTQKKQKTKAKKKKNNNSILHRILKKWLPNLWGNESGRYRFFIRFNGFVLRLGWLIGEQIAFLLLFIWSRRLKKKIRKRREFRFGFLLIRRFHVVCCCCCCTFIMWAFSVLRDRRGNIPHFLFFAFGWRWRIIIKNIHSTKKENCTVLICL